MWKRARNRSHTVATPKGTSGTLWAWYNSVMDKICKVPDCGPAKRIVKGLCNKHYKKHLRGVELDAEPHLMFRSLEERYWAAVDKSAGPDECWLWTACSRLSNTTYYGRIKFESRVYSAHRIGYEIAHGMEPATLPPTVPVHHTCGNSLCQQPKHLQATTAAENTAEMLERHAYLKRINYLETLLDSNGIPY